NAIIRKTKAVNGAKLLDVGCGAGKFCKIASDAGFNVTGFDASDNLIEIARERMPENEFKTGDMEKLPYGDKIFDVVTGINSFQFAGDIIKSVGEAKRVAKDGGEIVMAVWGRPEECEASSIFAALGPYMPQPPNEKGAVRKPLYTDGILEELASQAGGGPGESRKNETPSLFCKA